MQIETSYYERCIDTLERAHELLLKANSENIEYDMYRSACIKEFEIILEQSGKLLRKNSISTHQRLLNDFILKIFFGKLYQEALFLRKSVNDF